MKHFMTVKNYYDIIKEKNATSNYTIGAYVVDRNTLEENMVITCVFSAMAIEAFINDYIASRIGDAEFYDNYDKLSIESKFNFAIKLIMRADINKGAEYYYLFKKLFKSRNDFVHSKSKDFNIDDTKKYSENSDEVDMEGIVSVNLESLKNKYYIGRDAIKAILEIANFFEENDDDCYAKQFLGCTFDKRLYTHGEEPEYFACL